MKAKSKPLLHGVDWAVQSGAADEIMTETRRRVTRRKRRRLAAAGSACLIALASLLWFTPDRPAALPTTATPSSAVVTVPAKRTLPDGSVVELRPGAEISVDFTAETTALRRVRLLAGEALFQVAKDPNRPFIVSASGVEFRAVGTAFSVQIDEHQVALLVTEGTVAVDKNVRPLVSPKLGEGGSLVDAPATQGEGVQDPVSVVHPPSSALLVTAGNRLVVDVGDAPVGAQTEAVSDSDMAQRLAWRIPRLEFTQTPLSEVLPMINEHSRTRLMLDDPALGQVRISGILRADNLETLLRLLEAEHNIVADHRADGDIVLRAHK